MFVRIAEGESERVVVLNGLPPPPVFPRTRHDAGERVYTIREEEGRPEEEHLQHRFRAETEIYFTTQQKADAASITSLPGVLASRLVDCPAISSLPRRDRATALGRSARARTRQSNAEGNSRRASRAGGQARLLRPLGPGERGPRTNRRR